MYQAISERVAVCFVALFSMFPLYAEAASERCEEQLLKEDALIPAAKQTARLKAVLEKSQSTFALVSRVGSDISRKGLKYTHMGMFWKSPEQGNWRVTHLLNVCGSREARIFEHSMLDYFLDTPFSYDTLVAIPKKTLSAAIVNRLATDRINKKPDFEYSMIAHPVSRTHGNSNQWILEIIAKSQAKLEGHDLTNREQIHAYYRAKGFEGSIIRIWFLEALGGVLFRENVTFSDHTATERETGRYEFVSAKSVVDYLEKTRLLHLKEEIRGEMKTP
ncbi:MAG: DUF2145 domain-containing protein [Sneathiellales bacterium]|nr:DUF2145 domain-containing protein [Sneathiellales bacterium]